MENPINFRFCYYRVRRILVRLKKHIPRKGKQQHPGIGSQKEGDNRRETSMLLISHLCQWFIWGHPHSGSQAQGNPVCVAIATACENLEIPAAYNINHHEKRGQGKLQKNVYHGDHRKNYSRDGLWKLFSKYRPWTCSINITGNLLDMQSWVIQGCEQREVGIVRAMWKESLLESALWPPWLFMSLTWEISLSLSKGSQESHGVRASAQSPKSHHLNQVQVWRRLLGVLTHSSGATIASHP